MSKKQKKTAKVKVMGPFQFHPDENKVVIPGTEVIATPVEPGKAKIHAPKKAPITGDYEPPPSTGVVVTFYNADMKPIGQTDVLRSDPGIDVIAHIMQTSTDMPATAPVAATSTAVTLDAGGNVIASDLRYTVMLSYD